jgi:hypothetical protein
MTYTEAPFTCVACGRTASADEAMDLESGWLAQRTGYGPRCPDHNSSLFAELTRRQRAGESLEGIEHFEIPPEGTPQAWS